MLIICCGMPRSGSTLQFNVVWKILEFASLGEKVPWRRNDDWDSANNELREMALSEQCYAIKIHAVSDTIRNIARETGRVRYVYVHRDLRDVFVSMQVKFDMSPQKAITRIRGSLQLEDYLASLKPQSVLCQPYVSLFQNLPDAIVEISSFLKAELSLKQFEAILSDVNIDIAYTKSRKRKVPFEHLRRRISTLLRIKTAFSDEQLMLHPKHVSEHKGQIGIWKTKLNKEHQAMLKEEFGERIAQGFCTEAS